jgi:ribosome assembly protein 1
LLTSRSNPDKVVKIVGTLNLKIPPRELQSRDSRHLLSLIFNQWLSLSTCIIQTIIDVVPAPSVAQRTRIPKMLYPDLFEATIEPRNKLEEDLYACKSSSEACVAAYVSKMFAVPSKEMPEAKRKPATAEEMRKRVREAREARAAAATADSDPDGIKTATTALADMKIANSASGQTNTSTEEVEAEVILGFARIYSGTLRVGANVYALLPKYDTARPPSHSANAKHIVAATVEGLYTMMGRELVAVEAVRAGNVFAIKGLAGKVWRNATICAPGEEGVTGSPDEAKYCLINLGGVNRAVSVKPSLPRLWINNAKHRRLLLSVLRWSLYTRPTCQSLSRG